MAQCYFSIYYLAMKRFAKFSQEFEGIRMGIAAKLSLLT